VRIALGNPVAPIPELDRPSTVLAFRDRALEVAVVERMVLDLDRQALVVRVERWTPGDRPRLEDAVQLETEIGNAAAWRRGAG
jgi:hypothetical protein